MAGNTTPAYSGLMLRSVAWLIDNLVGIGLLLLTVVFVVRPLLAWYFFTGDNPYFPADAVVGFSLPGIWAAAGAAGKAFMVAVLMLGAFVPSALYFTALESSPWQASLGKRAAGVEVVDLQGQRVSPWRAFRRSSGRWLSHILWPLALVSVATILGSDRHQALHDLVSGCIVRRRRRDA